MINGNKTHSKKLMKPAISSFTNRTCEDKHHHLWMQCLPSFMITVTIVYTIGYTVASITQLWIHLINICFNSYTAIIISVQNIETEVILSTTTQKKQSWEKNTGCKKAEKKGRGVEKYTMNVCWSDIFLTGVTKFLQTCLPPVTQDSSQVQHKVLQFGSPWFIPCVLGHDRLCHTLSLQQNTTC